MNKFEYYKDLKKKAPNKEARKAIVKDWSLSFYGPYSHKRFDYSFSKLMSMGAERFNSLMWNGMELEEDKYGIVDFVDDYYYNKAVKAGDHSVYCF